MALIDNNAHWQALLVSAGVPERVREALLAKGYDTVGTFWFAAKSEQILEAMLEDLFSDDLSHELGVAPGTLHHVPAGTVRRLWQLCKGVAQNEAEPPA